MKSSISILWLTSKPTAGNRSTLILPAIAFAIITALLLIVLSGAQSFFTHPKNAVAGDAGLYQMLSVLALSVMILPLFTLGGSAARLSARRRDQKLSALRLLGASPRLVGALAVVEATVVAAAGILAGIVVYFVALPLVALIQFQGSALGLSALIINPALLLFACFTLLLLACISSIIGLRQVVLTPLGVQTRQRAAATNRKRLLIGFVGVPVLFVASVLSTAAGSFAIFFVIILLLIMGGLSLLNVVGPHALQMMAKRWLKKAKTPTQLLSARSVLESPKAAWRQVSSLSMTSFFAVLAGVGLGLVGANDQGASAQGHVDYIYTDMRTGLIITLVVSFLLVAASAGVNQAASILDRGDLYVSLDRLGMPRSVMESARRRAVMAPVTAVTLVSALLAALLVFPLTGLTIFLSPLTLVAIAAILAGGTALVWLGLRATAPVADMVLGAAK